MVYNVPFQLSLIYKPKVVVDFQSRKSVMVRNQSKTKLSPVLFDKCTEREKKTIERGMGGQQ